jgi:hypothetical protein
MATGAYHAVQEEFLHAYLSETAASAVNLQLVTPQRSVSISDAFVSYV